MIILSVYACTRNNNNNNNTRSTVAWLICRPIIIIIVVAATRSALSPSGDSKVIFFLSSLRTCREFAPRPYHFCLLARPSLSPPRCQRTLCVAAALDGAVRTCTRQDEGHCAANISCRPHAYCRNGRFRRFWTRCGATPRVVHSWLARVDGDNNRYYDFGNIFL